MIYLPSSDTLHRDRTNFPNKVDPHKPLKTKTMAYVDQANIKYETCTSSTEEKESAQETGWKGSYALQRIPRHERCLHVPVDPMHLIKNLFHCWSN